MLQTLGVAAGVVATGWPTRTALAEPDLPWESIGFSQAGAPLIVQHIGDAASRVLIIGGQHGAPEANTIELVEQLTAYYAEHLDQIPSGLGLDILRVANPDGAASGSRQYVSGVDPNRNWGGPDWESDAYDSNGRFRKGLGGPEPFSEQETRALADYLLKVRPVLTVNYHSVGGFILGSRDGPAGQIITAYGDASGYSVPQGGGGGSPLPYRATGSVNVWARGQGLTTMFIELGTTWSPEFDRNLAGLKAALAKLG
jgi:Zinc carboxypeptidase